MDLLDQWTGYLSIVNYSSLLSDLAVRLGCQPKAISIVACNDLYCVCVVRYGSDAGHRGSPPMLLFLLLLLWWWEGITPACGPLLSTVSPCLLDWLMCNCCLSYVPSAQNPNIYLKEKHLYLHFKWKLNNKCFPNSLRGGRLVLWTSPCSHDSFTDRSTVKTTKQQQPVCT